MSVVEAIRYGCVPLLPARLAYPEIIPERFHSQVLYRDQNELEEKLVQNISHHCGFHQLRYDLSREMGRFAWENLIDCYDEELEKLAHMGLRGCHG